MDARAQRIVETAVELAERDGFAAVRLRDVASQAQVALGTVYRRFRSKEDILIAALEQESSRLQARTQRRPPTGNTPLERVSSFFATATRGLCRKPNLARALLRAVASGDPDLTQKVARFHTLIESQITLALRGSEVVGPFDEPSRQEAVPALAMALQQVWFASMVGWAGGLHSEKTVTLHVETAARWLLLGLEHS